MNKRCARLSRVVVALCCLWILYATARAENQVLTVGIYNFSPLSHTAPELAEQTLFVKILRHIANREGWEITFVAGTLVENEERLGAGTIDLLLAAPYSRAREEYFDFCRETVMSTWGQVYTADKASINSITDLMGKTVGVVRDDPYSTDLRNFIGRFNVECEFVECTNYSDIMEALQNRWIDAGAVDRLYVPPENLSATVVSTSIVFSPIELRFAAPLNNTRGLLPVIDYHLRALKKDPYSVYYRFVEDAIGRKERFTIPPMFYYASLAAVGLIGLLIGMSLLLQRQVKSQTAALSSANQELRREIEMRYSAEDALRQSNRLLEMTIASMQDALLVLDVDTRCILSCNRAGTTLTGFSNQEILAMTFDQLHPDRVKAEEFFIALQTAIKELGFLEIECPMRHKEKGQFPAEVVLSPIRDEQGAIGSWVAIVRDITWRDELRRNERLMRQAQKMEAIGTLAGGIAHDFNNILMPIIGYTELLKRMVPDDDSKNRQYLDQILLATRRARELVSQILAFSRQKEQEKSLVHIVPILKETLKLLRASVPSSIDISAPSILSTGDTILADPTQIHQVVMNLCTNAAHAMKVNGGVLEAGLCDHTGALLGWSPNPEQMSGTVLRLWVRDTGYGMAPEVLDRIFDPFFTTKPAGEGTGMGLAVVHGIVRSCGGTISVETQQHVGTTFHVYFPTGPAGTEKKTTLSGKIPRGNNEAVLLVDDEDMIVDMTKDFLEQLGYRVFSKANGEQAYALFACMPEEFDIVITDQTMPGMTGGQLSTKLLQLRPQLPIILCTGYSESITPEIAQSLGIKQFIMKPFVLSEIAASVRELLDQSKGLPRGKQSALA